MGFTVAAQVWAFLGALPVGGALSFLWDCFRITRLALPLPGWFILLEDLAFSLLCGAGTFAYLLRVSHGEIRGFILLGELLGAVLWQLTAGELVMKGAVRLLRTLRIVLFRPLGRAARGIKGFFSRLKSKIFVSCKKRRNILRFRLKQRRVLLYNLIKHSSVRTKGIAPERKDICG